MRPLQKPFLPGHVKHSFIRSFSTAPSQSRLTFGGCSGRSGQEGATRNGVGSLAGPRQRRHFRSMRTGFDGIRAAEKHIEERDCGFRHAPAWGDKTNQRKRVPVAGVVNAWLTCDAAPTPSRYDPPARAGGSPGRRRPRRRPHRPPPAAARRSRRTWAACPEARCRARRGVRSRRRPAAS